jgi:HEPN domain-containing protein
MPSRKEDVDRRFEKGNHDLLTAKLALEAGGLTDTAVVLLQQASEKYVKGYLISRGWRLRKTHDLVELLDTAGEYNPVFREHLQLARRLMALYLEERYPSGFVADYSEDENAFLLEQTEKLIAMIEEETK